MNAIGYLLCTILKNKILSLRKKPLYLIIYGCIAVTVVLTIVTSNLGDKSALAIKEYSDIRILYAIIALIALLFLVTQIITGLSSGSTLFNMADVGLLFVSPISSQKILIYGLIKQMGMTLLSAIFILYQVPTIKKSFGLGMETIVYLLIIYAIIIFFTQLIAIATYILTNGNSFRKKIVKIVLFGIIALIILGIYYQYIMHHQGIIESAMNVLTFRPFQFIPVVGWSVMFAWGIIHGSIIYIILPLGLYLISSVAMILLFTLRDGDYYEDVLGYTEMYHAKLQDAKSGKMNSNFTKVKLRNNKTGMSSGMGASAIFYRHLLEKKRTSRFMFIDMYTILASIGSGFLCYYVKQPYSVYIVLGVLLYLQIFMTMFGKFSYELSKPYIYLIPEKSIKKVIFSALVTFLKPCVDAIIIFTVVCIFSKTSPILNIFLAFVYISTCAVFICYTILCQRLFGGKPNKVISGALGIALFLLLFAPAVGISAITIMLLPKYLNFLGTLPFTFVCIVITILTFVVCGDVLEKSEIN